LWRKNMAALVSTTTFSTVIAAKLQPKTIDLWHYVNAKF